MRSMAHSAFIFLFLFALAASVILLSLASCYPPTYYDDAYSPYAPDISYDPPTITFYLQDSDDPFYYQGSPYYHYYPYYPYYPPDYGNPFYQYYH